MKADRLFFFARRAQTGRAGSPRRRRTALAIAGLAAGVAALIVVMGVMNGLQGGYIDAILEVSSFHLRVKLKPVADAAPTDALRRADAAALRIAALKEVRSAIPLRESHGIALGPTGRSLVLGLHFLPVDTALRDPGLVKALNPALTRPFDPSGFGASEAVGLPVQGGIVLGREAAAILGLRKGGELSLLSVTMHPDNGLSSSRTQMPMAASFKSGYYEFDASYAFVSLGDPAFGAGANDAQDILIGVKLKNRYADAPAIAAIQTALGEELMSIQSWRDYNRSFFGALRTEKTVMFLLVGLIFAVVGVNIHHAMRRSVAMRMQDIALLRAIGTPARDVRAIFVTEGLTIGLAGAVFGACAGILLTLNLNAIVAFLQRAARLIAKTPYYFQTSFYLDSIPVRIYPVETLGIVLAAALSGWFAARLATKKVLQADPAEVLRHE